MELLGQRICAFVILVDIPKVPSVEVLPTKLISSKCLFCHCHASDYVIRFFLVCANFSVVLICLSLMGEIESHFMFKCYL